MATVIEIAKKNVPKKFWPLIDTYGVAFIGAEQEWALGMAKLLVEQGAKAFQKTLIDGLSGEQQAEIAAAEATRMARLCKHYKDVRQAETDFWSAVGAIFMQLLMAWMSSVSGVPVTP